MLFNSTVFIFAFLPILLGLYYIMPKSFRNYLLLLASLIFYAWGGVRYSVVLIGSVLFNYLFVRLIHKNTNNKKLWLTIGCIFNISLIVAFKYLDFFIENINLINTNVLHNKNEFSLLNIVLPLGISFFTFQQMSMLWDVYKNPYAEKPKLLNTSLYISFFPQLIAGPIVRYNDIINQIRSREESISLFRSGIRRFVLGLFKKVIIANQVAIVADSIIGSPTELLNSSTAWLGILSYSLQIYFDFSGYSDMAIGLGLMFGFKIPENFNFPYTATSIKDFWRRWHISLSSWFRDYVYIPMGGNRKGIKRTYFNLLIVFLLTGFWHGATWSFVFWGVFHGTFLIIERLGFDKILNKTPKPISWLYTTITVITAWVFFRVENFSEALQFVGKMFSFSENGSIKAITFFNKEYITVLAIALIFSSTIPQMLKKHLQKIKNQTAYCLFTDILTIAVLILCILYINSGSYSPFIYFRF